MTRAQAHQLVAVLEAAFPFPRLPDATIVLYVNELARCADPDAAREAIETVIRNEVRWPPLAVLHGEYRDSARRHADDRARARGLPEPAEGVPMPAEVRAWVKTIGVKNIEEPAA